MSAFKGLAVAFLLAAAAPVRTVSAEIPTPESVLGFEVGADRKLADWTQIVDYFHKLDEASGRITVEEVGKTTEGRPFLVAIITSEANMGRLEEIRQANLRLADPRGLDPKEAQRLIATGKTIVAHNHGIHSTEVAATQTSMQLAWELATTSDPALLEVLDKTVIVMLPSHNPDGTQMVTEWYRKSLGEAWEGRGIPFLYNQYVGHDNNRDWYMFSQVESQLTVKYVYDRWRPQIVHDLHQMGSDSARIFMPPYVDPWEPNVDPALIAASNAIGTSMAARMIAAGRTGVVLNAMYDGWTPARAYPHTHGGVRILTECASARMASPVDVKREDLHRGIGYDAKTASWNFPLPWQGGTWRLHDIVDYQMAASHALLEHAAANRGFWLANFYAVNNRAATRQSPFAYVIPEEQADPLAAARLLTVLKTGGVELQRARASFAAAGRRIGAGATVVLMAQPLERLRRHPARAPALSGYARVSGRSAAAAVRRHRAHAAAAAGRRRGQGRGADDACARAAARGVGAPRAGSRATAAFMRSATRTATWWRSAACCDRRWRCAGPAKAFTAAGRSFAAGTLLVPASALRAAAADGARAGRHRHRRQRFPAGARAARAARRPSIRATTRRWTRAGRASSSTRKWTFPTPRCTTPTCARAASCRSSTRSWFRISRRLHSSRAMPRAPCQQSTQAAWATPASPRCATSSPRAARSWR